MVGVPHLTGKQKLYTALVSLVCETGGVEQRLRTAYRATIASVDPQLGTVFYTLAQPKAAQQGPAPTFIRQTHNCLQCHGSSMTRDIPGLLLRSGVTPVFRQIGLPDEFLDAGALPTLHERYGISTEAMSRKIKSWQTQ